MRVDVEFAVPRRINRPIVEATDAPDTRNIA